MNAEKRERLDFLTRMAGVVNEALEIDNDGHIPLLRDDLARLVKACCLAEKEIDEREQRYFERLCANPSVSFYEA